MHDQMQNADITSPRALKRRLAQTSVAADIDRPSESITPDENKLVSPITGGIEVSLISAVQTADLVRLARMFVGDIEYLFQGVDSITLWRCNESGVLFFDPPVAGDDKFYSMLNNAPWYYMDEKQEYEEAARWVKVGDAVLDVGCGFGGFSDHLPRGASFTGLELTESSVVKAVALGRNVKQELIEAHAERNAERYDVVTSFQVVEHVQNPMQFMELMVRCARPGGRLVVAVPNDESFMGGGFNNLLNLPPHHLTRWTPAALRFAFDRLGLHSVELWREPLMPCHFRRYFHDLIMRAILDARSKNVPLVSNGVWFKAVSKLASPISSFLARSVTPGRRVADGHTVMAVGLKT